MRVENFEQLEVWQKAHAMALDVYRLTSALPEEEELGLILRMRNVACNVPSSIANGFERRELVERLSVYREARAAVEELRYYFILCRDLGYTIDFETFSQNGEQLARMVGGLVGSVARAASGRDGRGGGRDRQRGDNRDRGERGPRFGSGPREQVSDEVSSEDHGDRGDRDESIV